MYNLNIEYISTNKDGSHNISGTAEIYGLYCGFYNASKNGEIQIEMTMDGHTSRTLLAILNINENTNKDFIRGLEVGYHNGNRIDPEFYKSVLRNVLIEAQEKAVALQFTPIIIDIL